MQLGYKGGKKEAFRCIFEKKIQKQMLKSITNLTKTVGMYVINKEITCCVTYRRKKQFSSNVTAVSTF